MVQYKIEEESACQSMSTNKLYKSNKKCSTYKKRKRCYKKS